MSKLSEILEIIEGGGEWLHGGNVSRTVDEWLATGLQVDVIVDYVEAGCFDAECAKRLHDVGVYGDDLTNLVCEDYRVAVGYAFANGDITLDAVLTRYIQSIGEWAHNGQAEQVAIEWRETSLSVEEIRDWLAAGCFRAEAAFALDNEGITPDQASTRKDGSTIAYLVSKGDMSISQAKYAIDNTND